MKSKTESLTDQYVKDIHSLFTGKAELQRFSQMVNSLDEESEGRFIRACYLYQKAVKLRDSEPDISMTLLCSAIESMQQHYSSLIFKDWLKVKKLDELEGKTRKELDRILDTSYQEYIGSESEREGAMYNFKKFLLEHCPAKLREPPMKVYHKFKLPATAASFEESLGYIYSKFRSLFIHEGVPRLDTTPMDGTVIGRHLGDVYRGDAFNIDMMKVLDWFSQVVLESLWHWVISRTTNITT